MLRVERRRRRARAQSYSDVTRYRSVFPSPELPLSPHAQDVFCFERIGGQSIPHQVGEVQTQKSGYPHRTLRVYPTNILRVASIRNCKQQPSLSIISNECITFKLNYLLLPSSASSSSASSYAHQYSSFLPRSLSHPSMHQLSSSLPYVFFRRVLLSPTFCCNMFAN